MGCFPTSRGGLVCVFALALACCQTVAAAEQVGVVVLNSGGVLRGQVSVAGERYVVTRQNSVVDVPAAQVALVAESMDDAYQRQRRQLPRDTTEAHLGLAEWCLRHDLLPSAAQELADARRLDPRDPRVALLERHLAVARQPKAPRPAEATAAAQGIQPTQDELRELEAVVADLPADVVERFTRKVQPLLVNNCTTTGCHQPSGGQDFQLDRAVLYGLSNRRTTLRNLVATLELVDRDAPQQSLLLVIPRRSHGGMKRPILGPRQQEQLLQLVDWVALVTEAGSQPSVVDQPAEAEPDVAPARFEAEGSIAPTPQLRYGVELAPWRPRDAFDPEFFNRQTRNMAEADTAGDQELPATR